MKSSRKKASVTYPDRSTSAVSVREGKAHFSALIDRAAAGEEIIIEWHGQPRARLMPIPLFVKKLRIDRVWLRSMPIKIKRQRNAEPLIRIDRDSRG